MRIEKVMSKEPCFTSITNLYHLFYSHNIKEVLIDTRCRKYVDGVFKAISELRVDFNINEPIEPDYIREKDLGTTHLPELLQHSKLKFKYDLLVVHSNSFDAFIPLMHRATFIFVYDESDAKKTFIPYTKVNDCFEGVLYINDFHSIIFPYTKLNVYQQTYVRDKPYRFICKMQQMLTVFDSKVIVEIGSSRTPLTHELSTIDPRCCNDSHSTFFWCETKCKVYTVDINPMCESILQKAYKDKKLIINGKLKICNEDGLTFLKDYNGDAIDFLFLDAWDVIEGTDYAEKHLEAYNNAEEHLNKERCFLSIDDTDIANGGKGRLLIPKLINDGWIILYRGRHTVFYRGSKSSLWI